MSDTEILAYTDSKITELEDVISGQKKLLSEYEKELNNLSGSVPESKCVTNPIRTTAGDVRNIYSLVIEKDALEL